MDPALTDQLPDQQQNGSAAASPSPSMSMPQSQSQSQPSGGQSSRQPVPVSYPSPTSYPSPGQGQGQGLAPGQYSYPAPGQQQPAEPYRASPTGSNGSLSLPSMRSLDPIQQQQQQQQQQQHQHQHQQQQHQQHMGSPLPPPVAQMPPYYHSNQTLPHPSHQYPNAMTDLSGGAMRYALPAPDSRVMSGGRHKKEIKRRTKTGCLTCRKRRIKCDEAHPACRNCQKSKRECLGYDPIFKQQPGPSPIQPAPTSAPLQAAALATANPYGNQPSMLQGYGPQVPTMGYDPALSAGVSSPGSAQQFDYSSAIDPALEAVATAPAGADQYLQDPLLSFETPTNTILPAKPAKVDDLLLKLPSKAESFKPEQGVVDEIKHLWLSIYVPGLESFLESKYYYSEGLNQLMKDKVVLEQFAILLNQFAKTTADNHAEMAYTSNIEGRVVWSLACMVYAAADEAKTKGEPRPEGIPAADDPIEAANRLAVFDNLVTGQIAEANLLTKPPAPGDGDYHKLRELDFWYQLGKFVTLRIHDNDPGSAKEVDETLSALRNLLDGRENRDVLYSIAVVRALGQRVSEYAETDEPLHLDEQDARSKLLVAKRFVRDEGNGAGTTNVIRRFCELASRPWNT